MYSTHTHYNMYSETILPLYAQSVALLHLRLTTRPRLRGEGRK